MEKNKILQIIAILFALIIIVLVVWLIAEQPKTKPEDIAEEQKEEGFIPIEDEEEFIPIEDKDFVPVEIKNDITFQEAIIQLNTPQKLVDYLNKNFSFEEEESDQSMTPEEFFNAKKGKRNDVATFSSFVLYKNGYYATIFRYKFIDQENKESVRTITLFTEEDTAKYIDLEKSKPVIYPGGSSQFDLLGFEEKRHNIEITEYAAFAYGRTDLSKPAWLPH